jgi:SAM-dependent methyltransferase
LKAKYRVSTVWGAAATHETGGEKSHPKGWLDCDEVLWRYVFPRFGCKDWYRYLGERYCTTPRACALSLCCGDGHVERDLIKYGICNAAEGVDISPEAVAVCRAAAAEVRCDRLSYRVADIERERLPARKYDLIVAWMALHHLRRLGYVLCEVRRALAPGGIFVANEYIGPPRFQLPRAQVETANALLREIPAQLRRIPPSGRVKDRCDPAPLGRMLQDDPSEAVSSHRIIPAVRRHLEILERVDYGGSLLMILLSGIAQNFDSSDAEHRAVLDRLCAAEREALASGKLASDFAFIVARAR